MTRPCFSSAWRISACLATFVSVVALLVSTSGCGGCWKNPLGNAGKKPETLEEMEKRRKELEEKQKEKPDFETVRLAVLP